MPRGKLDLVLGQIKDLTAQQASLTAAKQEVSKRIAVLMREGDTMSYLMRLEAGAVIPPHDHPQTEECVVLEGEVRIGEESVHPGDYHVVRAGHAHELLRSDSGALLFLRGAVPSAKQVRWGSFDAYAALLPRSVREKFGRWKPTNKT